MTNRRELRSVSSAVASVVLHGLLSRRSIAMLVVLVGCSDTDCPTSACADGVNMQAPAAITDLSGGLLTVCVGECCRASEFAGGDHNTIAVVEQAQVGERATAVLEMPDGTSYSAEGVLERLALGGMLIGL